jgi:hypothetical protein
MSKLQPRRRSRYAPNEHARRAGALALELGVKLKLNADGSIEITGRLDSSVTDGLASSEKGSTADEALAAWEAKHSHSRNS